MVMTARRLMMGGTGGSSFAPAPVASVFSLATTGFWNDISEPRAYHYNGKTYLAWVTDLAHIWVAEYVHATDTLSTPYDLGAVTAASGVIHVSPSIIVRSSDRKIVVAAVSEGGSNQPAVWVSTNAEDATAFGSATLFGSAGNHSYLSLTQMSSATNDPIHAWTMRYDGSKYQLGYHASTDGGATWGSFTAVVNPSATDALYWRIGTDWETIVHIFVTNTNREDANPSSVYHLTYDGTTFKTSDGTGMGSPPFTATTATLIQDTTYGPARCDGWAIDGSGKPAALILSYDAANTRTTARAARWTGSAWQVDAVGHSGGLIASNRFISSGGMAKDDKNVIYLSEKVGSFFEMHRYTSADDGATWTPEQLTSSSSEDHAMPDTPANAGAGLQAIWGLGTYTSDSNFDFVVQGYGT